jgi:hypothetical protein
MTAEPRSGTPPALSGPPGERVSLAGWCEGPVQVDARVRGGRRPLAARRRASDGGFRLELEIPATGTLELGIAPEVR